MTFVQALGDVVGHTKQKRFIITVLKKSSLLADGSTLAEMWRVVAWSLNSLARGRYPEQSHTGGDLDEDRAGMGGDLLAEGLAGITLQMRGDWQWYCQCFHFPQWCPRLLLFARVDKEDWCGGANHRKPRTMS